MSNKKQKQAAAAAAAASAAAAAAAEETRKKKRKKVRLNSALIFAGVLVAMLLIFGGRWVWAIMETYYGAFVERYSVSVEEAVEYMGGLELTAEESESLQSLQREWDLFTSSRLCDEVTVTSYDGVQLHGYLYNEGSSITVVVIPRFHQDGTADFLPGTWLNELTDCNILMPDPRNHGESGGEEFSYGYYEQRDLVCWLDWAEQELGEQTFILWGEGSGANTILFAEANGLLPDSVAFAVAESPFHSLHEMAKEQIYEWYTVPAFPFLTAIEWKVNRKAGFNMDDTDLSAALRDESSELPVLFLTSAEDGYILPEWSSSVCELYSGEKEYISGGTAHGTVYAGSMDEIHTVITEWTEQYID